MAYDLFLRRQIPRNFSRGAEIWTASALTPSQAGLRSLAVMALGIGATLAASCPEIRQIRDRRFYLREFADDPKITQKLPAISDVTIMRKTKITGKRRQEQKQAERDLEADRRYYRRMYAKDRAITQEVPIVPMTELVQGGRQS